MSKWIVMLNRYRKQYRINIPLKLIEELKLQEETILVFEVHEDQKLELRRLQFGDTKDKQDSGNSP